MKEITFGCAGTTIEPEAEHPGLPTGTYTLSKEIYLAANESFVLAILNGVASGEIKYEPPPGMHTVLG